MKFCYQNIHIIILGLCMVAPGAVVGQQDDGARALEEIVVTARKREESLMEIPVSITAFSGEDLIGRNLTSIDQISSQTPGLVFSNSANISGSSNAAAVFIRGIGQSAYTLAVEPGVGIGFNYADAAISGPIEWGLRVKRSF